MTDIKLSPAQKEVINVMRSGSILMRSKITEKTFTVASNGVTQRVNHKTFQVLIDSGMLNIDNNLSTLKSTKYTLTTLGKEIKID